MGVERELNRFNECMNKIDHVLTDRGSKYAVTGIQATSKAEAVRAIKTLCRKKKFAKATHNTWALLQADGTQIKNDDGESGAGAIILRMLVEKGIENTMIVVTRWYGGVHLGGDRFRHVKTCVQAYVDEFGHS